jgi:hypothetical protein
MFDKFKIKKLIQQIIFNIFIIMDVNKFISQHLFDGLIDSDGHIDKTTRIETNTIYCFTNTSPQLIELFNCKIVCSDNTLK